MFRKELDGYLTFEVCVTITNSQTEFTALRFDKWER